MKNFKGFTFSTRPSPDGYKTMGVAGEAIENPSDLTKDSGRIMERRMVRVFSFRTFLTEECFEMVHYAKALNYLNRFSKISLTGKGIMLTWFLIKSLWLPANVKFKTN